ncbi:hypothetical protein QR680_011984 [Steinernema hermaphroditum]|uniref:G-protein coupled receptors family 1 profile domain-containing protein n=1 Tax=Steinernema hermaphroditum TaxID=289476 RepID=A0AA39I2Y3_9BILA|nr:hypothetical protein QR680_011984 [Steinernema hermaphroditum]
MPSNLTVLITLGSRQVPYEAHISWETLSSYRTTVAAFNIGAFPVIFPVYIYVVWLLLSKTDIKNSMPYQIMLNINFIDLVFLVENLMAGYFAFQHDHYHFHLRTLSEVLSCLRFGTLLANPFLYFTLALNRLIVVLNAMNITALLLFTFLPLILNFFTHTIHTTFNEIRAMYAFEAEGAIQIFIGVFGPVLYAASFLCYVAIVASILMKKHLYGASHSISPLEVRLIVQAFFLSVPPAVLILVGMAVTTQMGTSVWIYLFWNILSAVLPANTLINYILFNPIIRGHLFRITGKKSIVRPPTTVVQNTTTGQTKPVVVTIMPREADNLTVWITLGSRQVEYEAHIPWETFSISRAAVSAFNMAAFPLIFPFYVYVVWILISKTDIKKNMAYQIMININLLDLFFLFENFMSGYFAFYSDDYHFHLKTFSEVLSCLRFGTINASPLLFFTLALNRLMAILGVRMNRTLMWFYYAMTALALILFAPLPLLLHFSTKSVHYSYDEIRAIYSVDGEDSISDAIMLFGPVLYGVSFLCYIGIVVSIAVKKQIYGASYKISPREIRLIAQAFFLSAPPALLILMGMLLHAEIRMHEWIYVVWNISAALIPANTLINYIVFNSWVESCW